MGKKPDLNVEDRVVLLTEKGPLFGSMKWIGFLPERYGWWAGVEFVSVFFCYFPAKNFMENFRLQDKVIVKPADNQSCGLLDGRRYFACRPGHGDFVDVAALIKASDYRGSSGGAAVPSRDATGKRSCFFFADQQDSISKLHGPEVSRKNW